MSDMPTFEDFYAAVHHRRAPFPWQTRLAYQVAEKGWATEIGVPTGLGKTGCLDIAVWALAAQADWDPARRTAATRTWYVVNRRLLVDAAYKHGEKLCRWLRDPSLLREDWSENGKAWAEDGEGWDEDTDPAYIETLKKVAARLKSIAAVGSEPGPLHITRLRGGADLGARAPEPSQPALVFATVPMFASRWLFQGYGSSNLMRPVDAALAGIDSLVLLDEAHLAQPLARLVSPLEQCDVGDPAKVLPERARPRLVALTATGEAAGDRFELDENDYAHQVIRQRLDARKPTTLLPTKKKSLAADLASAAFDKLDESAEPTSCVVFANTVDAARLAFDCLVVLTKKLDVDMYLLTGRMREREASRLRERILSPESGVASERVRDSPRERHLVVVATQTLEVGADVDFDHLVTETSGVRSMVQRFGRLNRLGECQSSTATVVHPADLEEWPVYEDEPATVWQRLQGAAAEGEEFSLPPEVIADVLGEPDDTHPQTAELLPRHLWDWVKTSVPRRPEVPLDAFYDRIDDESMTVSVLWRAYIPGVPETLSADGEKGEGDQEVGSRVLVPPVTGDEAVEVPLGRLREAVEKRHGEENLQGADPLQLHRVRPDGKTVEEVDLRQVKPGDQVVLDAAAGMYDEHGWNPESRERVVDLSLLRGGLILEMPIIDLLLELPGPEGEVSPPSESRVDPEESARTMLETALARLRRTFSSKGDDDGLGDDDAVAAEKRLAALAEVGKVLDSCDQPAEGLDLPQSREQSEPESRQAEDVQSAEQSERRDWDEWRRALLEAVPADDVESDEGRRRDKLKHLTVLADGTLYLDVSDELAKAARNRRRSARVGVRSDAFDDLSFVPDVRQPDLDAHLRSVGEIAGAIVEKLGLPDDLATAVRQAGETHDLGKHERRFQHWLDPSGSSGTPLAKSSTPSGEREATRARAGWPRGGRHELLSARMLDKGLDDGHPLRDLLLHLVISHHGHGRPTVDVVDDNMPTDIPLVSMVLTDGEDQQLRVKADSVSGDLSVPDWEQPARFQRMCEEYGYWGVALLEAIVRQADHVASSRIKDAAVPPGAEATELSAVGVA